MNALPFAESVLNDTRPVMVACPVTKELYGYAKPVVDIEASMGRFLDAYARRKSAMGQKYPHTLPSAAERECARRYYQAV